MMFLVYRSQTPNPRKGIPPVAALKLAPEHMCDLKGQAIAFVHTTVIAPDFIDLPIAALVEIYPLPPDKRP